MDCIAVFDVGKTNKKILLYDTKLQLVKEVYYQFVADESGTVHFERVQASAAWFFDQLKALSARHSIRAVSITTHGATAVCLDEAGELALGTPAYTTPTTDEFEKAFAAEHGAPDELYREFKTPPLDLVVLGKLIDFTRRTFPVDFKTVRHILCLPQYFGYLLTGNFGAETTYAGCHSYLLDFETTGWSRMVDELGLRTMLPEKISRPGDILGTISAEAAERTGLPTDCLVTCGIHDSNASLVPFLIQNDEPFVLNSTGTWCVAMCPSKHTGLSEKDMDLGAFYNCDAFGHPVKTTIFMGGREREFWFEKIKEASGIEEPPPCDLAALSDLLNRAELFMLPGVMPGTGPFPRSTSRIWCDGICQMNTSSKGLGDARRAYNALNASLAVQSYEQLVGAGVTDGMPIYIEGGFRHSPEYLACLASFFPNSPILLTELKQATAFGAALLGLAALEGKDLKELKPAFEIKSERFETEPLEAIWKYREAFLEKV